jgi:hypothetical protein
MHGCAPNVGLRGVRRGGLMPLRRLAQCASGHEIAAEIVCEFKKSKPCLMFKNATRI